MIFEIQLPYPPTLNSLYKTSGNHWYMDKSGKDYKVSVNALCRRSNAPKFAKDKRLKLTLMAYPPDNRRRDISNLLKIVEDALQDAGVFYNDCQIKCLACEMMEKTNPSYIIVKIECLESMNG